MRHANRVQLAAEQPRARLSPCHAASRRASLSFAIGSSFSCPRAPDIIRLCGKFGSNHERLRGIDSITARSGNNVITEGQAPTGPVPPGRRGGAARGI